MTRLSGKVAVVTGASSGIGRATAVALARRGARVALVARSEDALRETARRIAEATGGSAGARGEGVARALVAPADVTDPAAIETVAARVRAELGPVDILVNNAGIGHFGPFADMPGEEVRRVMEVNFMGALHCTRAFLPEMLERGSGTVAFVSSGLGAIAFPGMSVYCASKFALNGFADSLRAEVEPLGVRVLLIMPGVTRTELAEDLPLSTLQRYLFQPASTAEAVGETIARAIERGRRRELFRIFNDVGLRFAAAFPGFRTAYLNVVGRRVRKEHGWDRRATGAVPAARQGT